MQAWAEAWNVVEADEPYVFDSYLAGMHKATASGNDVLGIRIMWESLDELIEALSQLYSDLTNDPLALIQKAFGSLKFIYLYREDVISQAISLYRAEQTGYWHTVEGSEPEQDPSFNFEAIKKHIEHIDYANQTWKDWFQTIKIQPLTIEYETFSKNSEAMTVEVLQFLEIDLPPDTKLQAANQRLADRLSIDWKQRYLKLINNATNVEKS